MDEGSISWDDEHSKLDQQNRHIGDLPDGNYQQTMTEIKYCCSTKGDVNKPINLPNTRPFYLMTYDSPTCQKVAGTKVLALGFNLDLIWIAFGTNDVWNSLELVYFAISFSSGPPFRKVRGKGESTLVCTFLDTELRTLAGCSRLPDVKVEKMELLKFLLGTKWLGEMEYAGAWNQGRTVRDARLRLQPGPSYYRVYKLFLLFLEQISSIS